MADALDRVTLRILEGMAQEHIRKHAALQNEREAIEWAERGEKLADAVEAFRALVRPDPIAREIARGLRR